MTEILALLTGRIAPLPGADEASAIAKLPVAGPVAIGLLGLAGDEQADRVHHGGPDKAIHHYPADHYAYWRETLGDHPLLAGPGGFGENVSTAGLVEEEVCIGDRFRLGSALVEVSQGRQPCWKLDRRFGQDGVMARIVATRRSGWYWRVIEPGVASAGDTCDLVERVLPQWSVARVFGLLIAGDHRREPEALGELAKMEKLAQSWRRRAVELSRPSLRP